MRFELLPRFPRRDVDSCWISRGASTSRPGRARRNRRLPGRGRPRTEARRMSAPRDLFVEANRLRLHLLEWGKPSDRPPLLLLHGFQEHAHAWDWLAPLLADAGHHVFAWDARGHGDSEWVGRGGYYHFADYVADVAFVVRHLGGRVSIVGHSMGGNVALLYTGTEPERVQAVAVIEGLGPPDSS